jgi:hypothetical protein
MQEVEELVLIRTKDLIVKNPDSRIQAMILKLKGTEALLFDDNIDQELLTYACPRLSPQTKQLLFEQVKRCIVCYNSDVVATLKLLIHDLELKKDLPPALPPVEGILGLTRTVRRKKAKDLKTSQEELLTLLKDYDTVVHKSILSRGLPQEIITELINKKLDLLDLGEEGLDDLESLANNENCPADILKELITRKVHVNYAYRYEQVRAAALCNLALPLKAFAELAKHPNTDVIDCINDCDRTPLEVLKRLTRHKDPEIREDARNAITFREED